MKTPRTVAVVTLGLVALLANSGHSLIGSAPDVATNQWVGGPSLGAARSGATAVALSGGHVLVTGGRGASGILASAELVTSGGAVLGVSPMGVPRSGHAALALDNGRVLVVGGSTTVVTAEGGVEVALASAEIYDPLANVWYPAGSLSSARAHASAARLSDGRVAIAGSADTVEIFDPETNTFSHAGTLGSVREGAAVAATRSRRVVIVGGTIGGVAQASADIVDLESGVVATVALTGPRTGATATTTVDDRVVIAGGSDGTNPLATTEILDPATGNSASGPSLSAPRANHQAYFLPHNGSVLLVGGSGVVGSSEVLIPWTDAVLATPPVGEPRTQTAGAGAKEGTFLVAGGSNASGTQSGATDYYGFATVTTDKDDYAPGQFVTITGTGWQPGETVSLVLHEVGTGAVDTPLNAIADEQGNFINDFWAPNESHLGVRFYLTATGAGATAQTTFTDGVKVGSVVVGSQTGTLTQGIAGSVTYSITVDRGTVSGSNGNFTAQLCVSTVLPAGVTASFASPSLSFPNATTTASTTLTLQTTASATAGTTAFTVRASNPNGSENCLTAEDFASANGSLVIGAASNGAPNVGSNNATVSFNEGSTATNSGTWSDTNPTDTVTLSASVGTVNPAGTNASGTWSWSYTPPDGPAAQTVTITANDGNGGSASTSFTLDVSNVPPTASFTNDGPVNEGSPATVSFSSPVDPSATDAASLRYGFSCSNGALPGSYATAGAASSTTCTFNENGTYTVSGRIFDKDGGSTDYTTSVVVNNVAPSIADTDLSLSAAAVNEGSSVNLSGSFTDPGASDTHTVTVEWGDGSANTVVNLAAGVTSFSGVSHTYADDNPTGTSSDTATIKVTVADDDTGSDDATTSITVNNVAPTIGNGDLSLSATAVNEGGSINLSGTFTDPGAGDTHTVTIEWGDASSNTVVNLAAGVTSFSGVSHTYADDNPTGTASDTATIKVTVTDDDTGSDDATSSITVNNVAPTVNAGASTGTADEGTAFTRGGSFTDPGAGDTWTGTVDYGDGTGSQALTLNADKTFNLSHTYADNGTFTVTVTVTDDDTGTSSAGIEVTVKNVAPTVDAGAAATINEGTSFASSGSFVDPGTDTWTATVNYGDGSATMPLALNADKTFALGHLYDDNGVYTVTVKVTDDDGGIGTGTVQVTVNNVAPTGTVNKSGDVNEGSAVTVSFSGQSDPSTADTNAGFKYAFSCANSPGDLPTTHALASSVNSASCTFGDNGTRTVLGRIFDKDNGYSDHTVNVEVSNVSPSLAPGSSFTFNPYNGAASATVNFTDPGWLDTFVASFNWAGSNQGPLVPTVVPGPPLAGTVSGSHTFAPGCIADAISVRVTDDDGGYFDHQLAAANTLGLYTPTFMAPLKDGVRNIVKLNNVIPVKLVIRDCSGNLVTNRTLSIFVTAGVLNVQDVVEGTELMQATSVSGADSTGVMRLADGHYMYNLATKGLGTGLPYTIVIKDGTFVVATAVVEAKK